MWVLSATSKLLLVAFFWSIGVNYVLSALLAGKEADAGGMMKRIKRIESQADQSFCDNVAYLLESDCQRLKEMHTEGQLVNILDHFLMLLGSS